MLKEITLEITTHCNLTCLMCPHGLPNGVLNKRHAADKLIDVVLSKASSFGLIRPTGLGEPLMAPGFWRIVDILAETRSSRLSFVTNGSLLTDRNVARLTRAPLHSINISVDAADEATYQRIRGNEMRKTVSGIQRLVASIETMPDDDRPRSLTMSMVLMRENIEETPAFIRLAHSLGVKGVYFEHLVDPFRDPKDWNVQRGNFHFNYEEQRLYQCPEYSDEHIIRAMDIADELGMQVGGPEVILSAANKHHNLRPCRKSATMRHRNDG
jgi:MoaA/NifB/PqqE/SkfB family radical SAM enzyme